MAACTTVGAVAGHSLLSSFVWRVFLFHVLFHVGHARAASDDDDPWPVRERSNSWKRGLLFSNGSSTYARGVSILLGNTTHPRSLDPRARACISLSARGECVLFEKAAVPLVHAAVAGAVVVFGEHEIGKRRDEKHAPTNWSASTHELTLFPWPRRLSISHSFSKWDAIRQRPGRRRCVAATPLGRARIPGASGRTRSRLYFAAYDGGRKI